MSVKTAAIDGTVTSGDAIAVGDRGKPVGHAGVVGAPPPPSGGRSQCRAGWVCIAIVAVIVGAIQLLALLDARLWVQPDSVGYVTLGQFLATRHAFTHELFAMRTPAYPLLLAGALTLARGHAASVLSIVQHAMVVGVALWTTLTAIELVRRDDDTIASGPIQNSGIASGAITGSTIDGVGLAGRVFAIAAGGASAFPLTFYASTLLTETFYTFVLCGVVYGLTRYLRVGGSRRLALCSLASGGCAMIRPVGAGLLALCLLAASARLWMRRRVAPGAKPDGGARAIPSRRAGRLLRSAVWAVLPGAVILAVWSLHGRWVLGVDGIDNFAGHNLYVRLLTLDHRVEPSSPALEDIRRCVAIVNRDRAPQNRLDYRVNWHAIAAYRRVHDAPLPEAVAQLGAAAMPILKAHWPDVAVGTIVNAGRTLLTPDPIYRYRPKIPPRMIRVPHPLRGWGTDAPGSERPAHEDVGMAPDVCRPSSFSQCRLLDSARVPHASRAGDGSIPVPARHPQSVGYVSRAARQVESDPRHDRPDIPPRATRTRTTRTRSDPDRPTRNDDRSGPGPLPDGHGSDRAIPIGNHPSEPALAHDVASSAFPTPRTDRAHVAVVTHAGAGSAMLFSTRVFHDDFRARLNDPVAYDRLGLDLAPGPAARIVTRWVRWFHTKIATARPPIPGAPGDTPYEQWIYLCVAGGLAGLAFRARMRWALLWAVVVMHLLLAGFFQGVSPRYAVPVLPFVYTWGMYAGIYLPARLTGKIRASVRTRRGGTVPSAGPCV